eukprot:5926790-Amphidinium_carterae.1
MSPIFHAAPDQQHACFKARHYELQTGRGWTIHPQSNQRIAWDLFSVLFIAYDIFVVPLVAFRWTVGSCNLQSLTCPGMPRTMLLDENLAKWRHVHIGLLRNVEVQEPKWQSTLEWVAVSFWTLDMIMNFRTGYYDGPTVERSPDKVGTRWAQKSLCSNVFLGCHG